MIIYYFNINFRCNSACTFCYSHNTGPGNKDRDITIKDFRSYLGDRGLSGKDRVIINGGEPLMHPGFMDLINFLLPIGCEVLIYTNGRLLDRFDLSALSQRFRFVIPIHGDEKCHDGITRTKGSLAQAIRGIESLDGLRCTCDLKVILNHQTVYQQAKFDSLLLTIGTLKYNGNLHLTHMAHTRNAMMNHIPPLAPLPTAERVSQVVQWAMDHKVKIKVFDTCISKAMASHDYAYHPYREGIRVFYKDFSQSREIYLKRKLNRQCTGCAFRYFCKSAVDEYHALTFENLDIHDGLE